MLGLVGKAVTFDTGGISIKPAADMDKMKFDMSGGAAMIGVMKALSQLKPAIKVIAVVPARKICREEERRSRGMCRRLCLVRRLRC